MEFRLTDNSFFNESTEQSRVKSEIVAKYLWTWAKVVIPTTKTKGNKIGYIDLFCGKGQYLDGTKSTPLIILEKAVADPDMCNMLVTLFNDSDADNVKTIKAHISSIIGIHRLKYQPQVELDTIDHNTSELFETLKLIPTVTFLDPWGYKGITRDLISSVIKDWGCECILFFNYNRISMGLFNPSVKSHMDALFGEERANELRKILPSLNVEQREKTILAALEQTVREIGGDFLLAFRFRSGKSNRISHHLVFVTKHLRGYEIMKDIMAKASTTEVEGVPSFEYSPNATQLDFPFDGSPIDKLKESLLNHFNGRTISVQDIYETHNLGTPYLKRNYKEALKQMESQELISATPPSSERRRDTIADTVVIHFK